MHMGKAFTWHVGVFEIVQGLLRFIGYVSAWAGLGAGCAALCGVKGVLPPMAA